MTKEITCKTVLKALREHEVKFSKDSFSTNKLFIQREDWHEDAEVSIPFYAEVIFIHPNYHYLISKSGNTNIKDVDEIDLCSMPRIKTVVEQLKNDGYLTTAIPTAQELYFQTEQEEQPTQPTQEEMEFEDYLGYHPSYKPRKNFINARSRFSKDELEALNIKILLTQKGRDQYYDLRKSVYADPIKWFKFIFGGIIFVLFFLVFWYERL